MFPEEVDRPAARPSGLSWGHEVGEGKESQLAEAGAGASAVASGMGPGPVAAVLAVGAAVLSKQSGGVGPVTTPAAALSTHQLCCSPMSECHRGPLLSQLFPCLPTAALMPGSVLGWYEAKLSPGDLKEEASWGSFQERAPPTPCWPWRLPGKDLGPDPGASWWEGMSPFHTS